LANESVLEKVCKFALLFKLKDPLQFPVGGTLADGSLLYGTINIMNPKIRLFRTFGATFSDKIVNKKNLWNFNRKFRQFCKLTVHNSLQEACTKSEEEPDNGVHFTKKLFKNSNRFQPAKH
jgi:hypothetical protein